MLKPFSSKLFRALFSNPKPVRNRRSRRGMGIERLEDRALLATFSVNIDTASISENGGSSTATVSIDEVQLADLVVNLSSDNPDAATVPGTVTIPANSLISSEFTISGVDDNIANGNRDVTITASADGHTAGTGLVQVTDDDVAGFTLSKTTATVSEDGITTDSFTVELTSEPTSNVVLNLTLDTDVAASIDLTTLTFDSSNWDTPQTVTITGLNDDDVDTGKETVITVAVDADASDDVYDVLNSQTVTVTTVNDDPGFMVSLTSATVSEDGSVTETFDVMLLAQPATDVVLTLTRSDNPAVTLSAEMLTFTNGNWDTPQTVTITGVNDDEADMGKETVITIAVDAAASDDAFDGLEAQTVTVLTQNDDAGFHITKTTATVSEDGSVTDAFDVVLLAQPATSVVLTLSLSDDPAVTLSADTLTFTSGNWSDVQTITLTGIDDDIADGDGETTVTIAVDAGNSDDAYDAVLSQAVVVTTTDDDVAGFTLSETTATVSEDGTTTDSFTVVLTSEPTSNVVLDLTLDTDVTASIDVATLTFDSSNWSIPQTVTITGINDDEADMGKETVITIAVNAAASDDAFDALEAQTVTVLTQNDDAGFHITKTTATVSEDGSVTDTFDVVLLAQPATSVVLTLSLSDDPAVTLSADTLTFTSGNWSDVQTITLTGIDDDIADGDGETTVTIAVDAGNSDDAYDAVLSQAVVVTTTDDDVAGFTLSETTATVSEDGTTTDSFTVVLTSEPTSNVVLDLTLDTDVAASIDVATLTFDSSNWSVPQTVTITGIDDDEADMGKETVITIAVNAAASDDAFDALEAQTVTVTTVNDDAGFHISKTTATVSEDGSVTDAFDVVLLVQPAADVVLTLSLSDNPAVTLSADTLTFTNANWNQIQTITLTGINDDIAGGDRETTVTIAVDADNSDDAYDAVLSQAVVVTTTDDDTVGFTLSKTTATVSEDGTTTTDSFTVVLTSEPTSDVVLNLTLSDNPAAAVALTTLTFTSENWDTPQTVTITGINDDEADMGKETVITIAVDAAASDDAFDALESQTITVTTQNDDPGFHITKTTATVSEDGSVTDAFDVVLLAQPTSDVVLTLSLSDDPAVTLSANTLTFTNASWNQIQTITITGVEDTDAVDKQTTITISVDAAQSDDAFDALPSQVVTATTINNDGPALTISSAAAVIEGNVSVFTVTISEAPAEGTEVTVELSTVPGTAEAGSDFIPVTQTLTFTSGGPLAQTISVTTLDDTLVEGTETFTVVLSNAVNGYIQTAEGTGTILDNDQPSVSVADVTVTEGQDVNFVLTLDQAPVTPVTFNIATSDVTATAGSDYTALPVTTVTFNPGDPLTQTVTIATIDDSDVEPIETFSLNITNGTGVTLATTTATATLISNDGPAVSISGPAAAEEGSDLIFTITLDVAPLAGQNVTVQFTTVDGTAIAGTDYTAVTQTITFTSESGLSQQITVATLDDTVVEPTKTFTAQLSMPNNGTISTAMATGTILSSDIPTISVTDAGSVAEGSTATFIVSLDQQPLTTVTVTVSTSDGEALNGSDYTALPPTVLTFEPGGPLSQEVTVATLADEIEEATEKFFLNLSAPNGAVIGTAQGFASIFGTRLVSDPVPRYPESAQPTFTWPTVVGAANYEVWLERRFPAQSRVLLGESTVATPSFTPSSELDAGAYRLWVRSLNTAGDPGPWSAAQSFEIRPTLVSPVVPTHELRPTFTWNEIPNAPGYTLFLRTSAGDTVIENITETSYTPQEDLPGGPVRWWIRSSDAIFNLGWSLPADIGNRTSVLTPTGVLETGTPEFTWVAVTGTGRYDLYVQNMNTGEVALRNSNLTTTSFTPSVALPDGNYRVWVKAIDAATDNFAAAPWSVAQNFTISVDGETQPLPSLDVTLTAPTGTITTATPTYTWGAVEGATRYELWVRDQATGERVVDTDQITETSFTPIAALTGTNFRVWVRAIDATTNRVGAWSAPLDFTVDVSAVDAATDLESLLVLTSLQPLQQDDATTTQTAEQVDQLDDALRPVADVDTRGVRQIQPALPESDNAADMDQLDAWMADPTQLAALLEENVDRHDS